VTTSGQRLLQLYFVRHGETQWSLSGQHTGRTDIALTLRGEDQARSLGAHLRGIPFARVLTSPRQRAQRTCELAGFASQARIEPDLQEWDYGDYEGQCSVDIREARPDWDVFKDGCPNGETPLQISERVDRLIAKLSVLEGNVALFSHGQLRVRPGSKMDWGPSYPGSTFRARRGFVEHSRPRGRSSKYPSHNTVEQHAFIVIRYPDRVWLIELTNIA
jgi:probable phosphoglycerate mutase